MTEITPGEIKLIYIQIVMMAIMGIFIFLYVSQPITQNYDVQSSAQTASNVDSKDASWIGNLMPSGAGLGGIIPLGELLIVSSIFLIPLTIMNAFTLIRFVKDIATQWV